MLFGRKRKKRTEQAENRQIQLPELYEEREINLLETYITEQFGAFESVFHEIVSPDIHVDIAIIPPSEQKNYYTLVTMGMGAHRMQVPPELSDYQLERAEIVACLPADWELSNSDEKWYWPLRWMKILARLPIEQDTWLGFGHTVPNGEPFAENTKLCCMLLTEALCKTEETFLTLPNQEVIRFYQMFPIYEEEMNEKIAGGAEALLQKFGDGTLSPVIDPHRNNVCAQ